MLYWEKEYYFHSSIISAPLLGWQLHTLGYSKLVAYMIVLLAQQAFVQLMRPQGPKRIRHFLLYHS